MTPADAALSVTETTADPGVPPLSEMLRLTAYADVAEVLKSSAFVQAGGGHRSGAELSMYTLLSLSGGEHVERRRLESPLFRRSSLARYEREVMAPLVRRALERCRSERGLDGLVHLDLLPFVKGVVLQVSAALVGLDDLDDPAELARLSADTARLSAGFNLEWTKRGHAEVMREARAAREHFRAAYFQPAWERRRALVAAVQAGQVDSQSLLQDLITLLIQDPEHFARWSDDIPLRETIFFLLAATGGPSDAIAQTIAELSFWLGTHREDAGRRDDPIFLRAVASEAIRLHPGTPVRFRRAIRDTRLSSGQFVESNEHVALDLVAANRDSAVFGADADTFNPYRALRHANPPGMAFGAGPHTCLGMALTIGESSVRPDQDSALGLLVRLLLECYRAGVELDPDRPPTLTQQSRADQYATFPVRFSRL
jgi:cytochrome P450